MQYHKLDTPQQIEHFLLVAAKRRSIGQSTTVCFDEPESHITQKQSNSMHLWCQRTADQLNDSGYDMKKVLKPEVDIPWSKDSVKEQLWKPVLLALTGKTSTKDQTSEEVTQVLNTINRHLGEKFGVTLPEFPHNG